MRQQAVIAAQVLLLLLLIIGSSSEMQQQQQWKQVNTTSQLDNLFDFSFAQTQSYLFMFGGVTKKFKVVNDLHAIHLNTLEIFKLTAENTPTPRKEAAGFICGTVLDQFVVVGGMDAEKNILNEMWSLSVQARAWKQIGQNELIQRTGHYGTCVGKSEQFVIFGGENASGRFLNDLILYNGTGWHVLAVRSQQIPRPRKYASVVYVPATSSSSDNEGSIVVFGGLFENKQVSNELWQYSLTSNEWKLLSNNSDIPIRNANNIFYYRNSIVVFGGESARVEGLNDLWAFHLLDGTWQQINTVNNPPGRLGSGMMTQQSPTDLTLSVIGGIGGWTKNTTVIYNDIWSLTLPAY